jgi:hypothetical protein
MLGHFPRQQVDASPAELIPWLKETLLRPADDPSTEIQLRLRGNILHVLCESAQAELPRDEVLLRLVRQLMEPETKAWLEADFPQISQVYIYSRQVLETKPLWSAPIYLNRLERHLERLVQSVAEVVPISIQPSAAPALEANALEIAHLETADRTADINLETSDLENSNPETSDSLSSQIFNLEDPHLEDSSLENAGLTAASLESSNLVLARQGDSAAIAQYLSKALSALNVGVKVSARVVPGKARRAKAVIAASDLTGEIAPITDSASELAPEDADRELVSRLWVFCEASYSPDPLLIAEPIAQRLRQLHLRQFQDAVITIQVTGEAASDWRLRVDLTPPEEMLREWARWGDVPALARLVNQIARRYGLKLIAEVKKATLHLISYSLSPVGGNSVMGTQTHQAIDIDGLVADISQLLGQVAPQGLHRAMLYGPSTDDISPEWLRGIDLPAMQRPALAETTASLAAKGDLPALAYCLTRALNPDISDQLATGGMRVQLLLKDKLLHVMADGPICPPKHAIVPLVTQSLKQLAVPDLDGIRLYGRRAGQKQPIWSHGHDYRPRPRMVPEAKPEFAASEAYIGELITPVSPESLEALPAVEEADIKLTAVLTRALQYVLVKSQIFTPLEETAGLRSALPSIFQSEGGKMAMIWGAVGLLLAVQFDFMVGQALRQNGSKPVESEQAEAGVERVRPSSFNDELASLDWNGGQRQSRSQSRSAEPGDLEAAGEGADETAEADGGFLSSDRFDSRDFTASAINDDELIYSPQQDLVSTASLLSGSTLPSFRSQQLDEKLALYQRRVAQSGPPDVLVIGSSRALRGVDPAALRQALKVSGHEGLSVFNFGVNGATAQVVDLVVRRLIAPDQLPQIVVWADGARAFNSGREDVTFNAIAVSEGYKQLEAGSSPNGIEDLVLGGLAEQLSLRTQTADRQLSEGLGRLSFAHDHRGRIRAAIGQGFGAIAPEFSTDAESTRAGDTPTGLPSETSLIDFDGFLALSTRFNPATYYQDHARVAGAYDGDYKSFQLEGKQTEALDNLLAFTAAKNVPVIFINTPLTDDYLDAQRVRAENQFKAYMLQVADRSSALTFRDLGRLWPQRYDYFSDPSHLNRYGAYQVSNRIAQDPMIPWPQVLPEPEPAARN